MFYDENVIWLIGLAAILAVYFIFRTLAEKYSWKLFEKLEFDISNWIKEQADKQAKREEAISIIVDKIYLLLPYWVQAFINKNTLKKQLNLMYGELLDYLDDGKLNDSIK